MSKHAKDLLLIGAIGIFGMIACYIAGYNTCNNDILRQAENRRHIQKLVNQAVEQRESDERDRYIDSVHAEINRLDFDVSAL